MFDQQLAGKGAMKLVYLCNDGQSNLKPSKLLVHEKPSIQELVKAGVINDGRKHLHIGSLSEFVEAMNKKNITSGKIRVAMDKIRPGITYTSATVQEAQPHKKLKSDDSTEEPKSKVVIIYIQFLDTILIYVHLFNYLICKGICHSELCKDSGGIPTSNADCY